MPSQFANEVEALRGYWKRKAVKGKRPAQESNKSGLEMASLEGYQGLAIPGKLPRLMTSRPAIAAARNHPQALTTCWNHAEVTMDHIYLLQNQDKLFLTKQNEWSDGRDLGSLFKTRHRDEALNHLVEVNAKDIRQRIRILECAAKPNGFPDIAPDDLPPAFPKVATEPDAEAPASADSAAAEAASESAGEGDPGGEAEPLVGSASQVEDLSGVQVEDPGAESEASEITAVSETKAVEISTDERESTARDELEHSRHYRVHEV